MAAIVVMRGITALLATGIIIVMAVCAACIVGVLLRTLVMRIVKPLVHHAIAEPCEGAEGKQDAEGGFHRRDP